MLPCQQAGERERERADLRPVDDKGVDIVLLEIPECRFQVSADMFRTMVGVPELSAYDELCDSG